MIALMIALATAATFTAPVPIGEQPWIVPDDYPDYAFNAGLQGAQRVAISVDTEGKPVACKATMVIGSDKLGAVPCRLIMKRARFMPAQDGDGAPVAGVVTYGNSFTLPGQLRQTLPYDVALRVSRLPDGLASPTVGIEQLVDAEGKILSCRIAHGSGSGTLDDLACSSVTELPVQPVGPDGRPARGVVSQSVLFVTNDQAAPAKP